MNHSEYRKFSEFVEQRHVVFYYYGYFSQSIILAMADTIKLSLASTDAAPSAKRRLFSCFVEMAQNIVHYSARALTAPSRSDAEVRQGSMCIGREGDRLYLLCANHVAADEAGALREKLETLRTMTLEDIKRAYQTTLRSERPESSKGAGLGFLTVARDASEPLDFGFVQEEGGAGTMFYLKAVVKA